MKSPFERSYEYTREHTFPGGRKKWSKISALIAKLNITEHHDQIRKRKDESNYITFILEVSAKNREIVCHLHGFVCELIK